MNSPFWFVTNSVAWFLSVTNVIFPFSCFTYLSNCLFLIINPTPFNLTIVLSLFTFITFKPPSVEIFSSNVNGIFSVVVYGSLTIKFWYAA